MVLDKKIWTTFFKVNVENIFNSISCIFMEAWYNGWRYQTSHNRLVYSQLRIPFAEFSEYLRYANDFWAL